jgi:hypothetical protein
MEITNHLKILKKKIMQSQTKHNNLVVELTKNDESILGQLSKKVFIIQIEVNDL